MTRSMFNGRCNDDVLFFLAVSLHLRAADFCKRNIAMAHLILAVDDEPQLLEIIKINLKKAGYEVETAANGREALDAVQAKRPDLIVLDVMMPVMDGFEALQVLKADEATNSIPVVMLTANAEDKDVMKGWQSGAHAYLNKPFNLRELLTFVQTILADEAQAGGKNYEVTPD